MSDGKNYYSIGKVSALCSVPIKTLRYYDKIGLLVPDYRKDESNYRYYTQEQILTLFIIRKLRALGIPLKEIHQMIMRGKWLERLILKSRTKPVRLSHFLQGLMTKCLKTEKSNLQML